jgi:hypothetical protein
MPNHIHLIGVMVTGRVLRKLKPGPKGEQVSQERETVFFEKNKEKMSYPEFGKQGRFVGSGVAEARCRTVIGQRLKFSGMH